MQDDQLLTQYAQNNSEAAFSQLIARHLPLVYRTCRRELGSDTLAEDAAQVVFLLLARKAKSLRARPSLAGWLFQTARFVAKDVRKQEARRTHREEAVMQEAIHQQATPTPECDTVEPLLNTALASLKPTDREALLLRFCEGHTLAETGTLLGLSEDAARMRCARALDKLRHYLASHGAAVTSVVLTGFLITEAAHPIPTHAAATITQGTLQAISASPAPNVLLLSKGVSQTMKIIKIKYAALAATVLLVGASVPLLAHAFSPHKANIQVAVTPKPLTQNATTQITLGSPMQPADFAYTLPAGALLPAQPAGTQAIVLQHVVAGEVVASQHWDQPANLPVGVTKIEAIPAQNMLAVTATSAGFAKVQEIVRLLDIEPRQIKVNAAFALASAADLKASGIQPRLVPLDDLEAGKTPATQVEYMTGTLAARFLQTLTDQNRLVEVPKITTTDKVTASISSDPPSASAQPQEFALQTFSVTPQINTNSSVTLVLDTAFLEGPAKRQIRTTRTLQSGETLVIVMPPPSPTVGAKSLLLFVTPTAK